MLTKIEVPAYAAIDVGAKLDIVVGFRPKEKVFEVVYVAWVSSFTDHDDVCQRFYVKTADRS